MPIVLLLFLGGVAFGCGESKQAASDNMVAEAVGDQSVSPNEQEQSKRDDVVAEALGDEFAGLKKTDSEKILADPGGTTASADFDALSASEQGASLDESISEAMYGTGKDQLEARKFKEAITVLKKAVENNPKDGRAFLAMGQAHSALGDLNSAKDAFEKAINAAGDADEEWVAEAYRLLGYAIRETNGSRTAQRTAWENYLDRLEGDTDASREVRKLLIPLRDR